MRILSTFAAATSALGLLALAGTAIGAPPFSTTSIATSGQSILDVGLVNSSFYNNNQVVPCTGGRGIIRVAVNNSGQWLIQTDSPSSDTFADGALISSTLPPQFGMIQPYLIEGTTGYLTAPTSQFIAAPFGMTPNVCSPANPFWADNTVGTMAVTNSGTNAMMLRVLPSAGADRVLAASSAVYFNLDAVIARQGQLVNAAGLDAGTVWGSLTSDTATMGVNGANQFAISAPVVELGVTKRAVIVVSTDSSGNVIGTTLIAKEGGPVGGGPATWTTLTISPNTIAINDSGTVIFSGQTSTGITGLFMNGAFVAVEGGATPVPGKNWGSLLSVPLDLNNRGEFVFRALVANGSGTWNETVPDAGEETDGQNGLANVPADSTLGNGPLNRLVGSLSSDTDVDMYRIRIEDPLAFSATTVPDAGSGFPGAAFDTVLYLIREPGNGTGCVERCDDVSPTVLQSTLTNAFVPAAGDYYIAVTTPKTRALVNKFFFGAQVRRNEPAWIEDPGFMCVGGGQILWGDPSAGVIHRALTSTGAAQADAVVANPQTPSVLAGQTNLTGPVGAFFGGGIGKVYWVSNEPAATRIRRANFDGSAPENLVTNSAISSVTSVTGIAADSTSNLLFWSRAAFGEIWRSNLGGGSVELMIKDPEEITVGVVGDFVPMRLAVGAGFVYWTNNVAGKIQRAPQNTIATSDQLAATTIVSNVQAEQLAVDAAGGKIYWTETASNVIKRANLNGTSIETFLSTPRPLSIAVDGVNVYWSNGDDRVIRKSPIAAPVASTLVNVGPDLGVTIQDVMAQGNGFSGWERVGASTPGALPYQIKLTGASPRIPDAMIAKNNNQKVAATYDEVPGRPNSRMTVIGSTIDSFKLSDRGDVMWRGSYFEPTVFINYQASALFLNNEAILLAGQIPPTFTDRLVFFYSGPGNVDFSRNGEWAVVSANTQVPPFNFTFQPDRALLLNFSYPPSCIPDFNQDGSLDPDDLGDFINCYFAPGCPQADFNHDGSTDPDDLGDYINAYFAGC